MQLLTLSCIILSLGIITEAFKLPFKVNDVLPVLPREISWPVMNNFGKAVDLLPSFVGTISPMNGSIEWSGACFNGNKASMEFTNGDDRGLGGGIIHLKTDEAHSWTCMDLYVFATPYRITWDFYFTAREHTYTFESWEEPAELEYVKQHGVSVFLMPSGMLGTLLSLADVLPLFSNTKFGQNANLAFLKTHMGATFETRPEPWRATIDPNDVHSGDFLAVSKIRGRWGGFETLEKWVTGAFAGHTAVCMKDEFGNLWVGESGHTNEQISHWNVHKDECGRLKQQMCCVEMLNAFPFTFSREATYEAGEKVEIRCSFLDKLGIHRVGMWICECSCGDSVASLDHLRSDKGWSLSSRLSPCRGPLSILKRQLTSWNDYYEWRGIPLDSPVALLLHWPLTIYQAIQLAIAKQLIPETTDELCIHYLGPERELYQLAVFGELHALLPGVQLHIDFVGPAVPDDRDGETTSLCSFVSCVEANCSCKSGKGEFTSRETTDKCSPITLTLHSGYYHDRYIELTKEFIPDLIIAPNAGIAAYTSWLPTIELIREIEIPSIFSDYCEEACHLAVNCITSVTGSPPSIPVQLNPFRQPLAVEDSALLLPCYSNCFLFGI